MKKYLCVILGIFCIGFTSIACSNSMESGAANSKPTPQTGDLVQVVGGLLPDYSLDDLISISDNIVIGYVKEILPAQKGIRKESRSRVIYTDVLIEPQEVLLGEAAQDPIIVRIWGGKVGNEVDMYENEPVFTMNEQVLVFISKFSSVRAEDSDDYQPYYRVNGCILGKYNVRADRVYNEITGESFVITTLKNKVALLK